LEIEKSDNNILEIQVAKREQLPSDKKTLVNLLFLTIPFFVLVPSFLVWSNNNKPYNITLSNSKISINDGKILGHYPYDEISEEDLIKVEPYIYVHKDMYNSLLKMREEAGKEGIYLVFLSGYRSIKLQEEIFYSLKSQRNQNAAERAKVSAPPGYSEHSTGFAIDIGDAENRQTDFEVDFENTKAFDWLKKNASRFHFKLSFDRNHKSVDYEPWHWRYEGSIKALKLFEASNRD
tara:strand:+ start:1500 stop:2204 length:705 start_codon:yes stop_codon:yes gene_type:complete